MLYIASALTPTPVSHTVLASNFTAPGTQSLLVAKPDRLEVWDVGTRGLTSRGELLTWGTVAGLATVDVPDARPHVLVLVGPTNGRLLLLTWEDGLVVTASHLLAPPTPALRRQEFFTGVIAHGNTAIVSMWTGVLTCAEMDMEKVRDLKRRASVAEDRERKGDGRRLIFKTVYNVNIREHNLLGLTFLPGASDLVLMFLWMNEQHKIQLGARTLSKQRLHERGAPVDVVNPTEEGLERTREPDFNAIPFSCPAARSILAVSSRHVLIFGDEHVVLYDVSGAKAQRANARRSPQTETGGVGKRRKSSVSGRGVSTDNEGKLVVQPVWRVRQGWGTVLAATVFEGNERRATIVLGDERGRLTAVGWEFDGSDSVRVSKVDMGIASPPTALTYIDNGVVFVSSACGDSLLVRFSMPEHPQAQSAGITAARNIKGKGRAQDSVDSGAWSITFDDEATAEQTVLERWMNLAPLKDLAVVKDEDGPMSHLVVASGSANTNSLRIVRSGVGLESLLSIEGVKGIERLWAYDRGQGVDASSIDQAFNAMLIVSFASSTAVLHVSDNIVQVDVPESFAKDPTIACHKNDCGLVQVTSKGFTIWELERHILTPNTNVHASINLDSEVVAAAFAGNRILVAQRNGVLKLYHCGPQGLEHIADNAPRNEVSAVALYQEPNNLDDASPPAGGIWVAAAYHDGTVTVFNPDSMDDGDAAPLVKTFEESYAVSLKLYADESKTMRLMAGLADGTLVSCDVDEVGCQSGFTKGRTQNALGLMPLDIADFEVECEGLEERVLAVGISDHMSLVFESRRHLEFSASGKKNVVAAAPLQVPNLGLLFAIATRDGITLERLTSLKKLQVLTWDTGDSSATRLAYVPHQDILAVGSVTRSLDADTGDVFQASSLDLHHPTTLEFLTDYLLPEREAVASVNVVFLNERHFIALGTAIFPTAAALDEANIDEVQSFVGVQKGRLLLMEATELDGRWSLKVVEAVETNGAVFDATVNYGYLAVASANKVSIMKLSKNLQLQETASFTFAFEAHHLTVLHKDFMRELLILGDAMRSIIVIELDNSSGEIFRDARDMSPHAVRALGTVGNLTNDDRHIILADGNGNLLTYRMDEELSQAAGFGLHEDVTRFRNGAFVATDPKELRPDLLFATANGRLGVAGELSASATRTLSDLQRNMAKYKRGPGNVDWRAFRRGGSILVPKETAGFIDGDFVQTFLDDPDERYLHGKTEHERVLRIEDGAKRPASEKHVRRVLEACAGVH
ncbi:hypothetical protein CC85DRAFT_281947 [Cutaneotrichosporon oleaginosum]|uniref:DNA damage-binding protein 1 n=1 Tax=Cutaneotrichosporon oleaginosum TaxID=879819 RepID=A0A0J1BE14_9TREE|nr:uncharacterized protein CC85DRAFT_281947 [Cutaneotrichosporon oleaginosum]KLT46299.1 hypothetical protein CC85DRAFT_281947 [Cutaneotrichosporon oleaginosum]